MEQLTNWSTINVKSLGSQFLLSDIAVDFRYVDEDFIGAVSLRCA